MNIKRYTVIVSIVSIAFGIFAIVFGARNLPHPVHATPNVVQLRNVTPGSAMLTYPSEPVYRHLNRDM